MTDQDTTRPSTGWVPRTPTEVADVLTLQAPPIQRERADSTLVGTVEALTFDSDIDGLQVRVTVSPSGHVHVYGTVSRDVALAWVAALGAAPGAGDGRFPPRPAESTP